MASNINESTSTTSKTVLIKPSIYDHKKFYPDMFDIVDHDNENENNINDKELWDKIKAEFDLDYKFDNTYDNMQEEEEPDQDELVENTSISSNDDDDDVENQDNEISREQVLSQRLSQLSTTSDYEREPSIDRKRRHLSLATTNTTLESATKKFRTSIDDTDDTYVIPEYLLSKNKLFDRMIQKMISITNPIELDNLRQMASFIHQIAVFNKLHDLWSAYLRAGIGLLNEEEEHEHEQQPKDISIQIDRRYWSNDVTSIIQANPDLYPPNMTEEDKHVACQNIIYKHLREYREKIATYEHQFDDKKAYLIHWTSTIEEVIRTFVQQYGIVPLRMKYDNKIGTLTCQYEDQILQRQYQQQQPTDYQKQIAQRLYDVELQLETAKSQLIEHRQRVINNKPPVSYDSLQILLPSSIYTLTDIHLRRQLLNRYEKLIQQTKTDLMAVYIAAKQVQIYQYQTLFDEEIKEMNENTTKHVSNKEMSPTLKHLIRKRSLNMKNKLKIICNFTMNYYIQSSYSELETMKTVKTKQNIKQIGFLSNLIINPTIATIHQLTNQQLQLLNRGPTYVAPCQMHVSSSFQTIDSMIKKQYAQLKHQLAVIFDKYNTYPANSMNFQIDAYKAFQDVYSIPLPNDIYERALDEKKLIQSIRRSLKKNNLILRRTADQNNTFYFGQMDHFINVSNQYMENNTDTYNILIDINEINEQDIQKELNKKYLLINTELEKLFNEKKFSKKIHKRLQVKINNVKLPYLYFLPNVSTTNSPFQVTPMFSTHQSATSKLALYLKQILRPFTVRHMHRRTFVNEADFIEKLNSYTNSKEHHFHSTTLFATIKITNFHTIAAHNSLVNTLVNFLTDNLATNKFHYTSLITMNHLQCISIDTIKKLTELYLDNNIFYYNGKIYELKKGGGPTSFLFSEILSNIYLFAYENLIFDDPRLKIELYGRYKDQIFFTWNQSKDELKTFLDDITQKYSHIHMETSFGTCVQFFNGQIENRNGHLYTCVYHDPQIPKYTLPYVVGHAKLKHSLWFRSALIRAVRFCSNFVDFNQEQIYLEMACLANGYSIDFIDTQLKHFYLRFNAEKIRFCLDQSVYERLRRRLFDFIKVQRTTSDKNQELDDKEFIFRLSYPYDYGPYNKFNEKFHKIWLIYLKDDAQLSHKDTKIILNTKHIYSLNTLLAQEKPSHELLKISKKITL